MENKIKDCTSLTSLLEQLRTMASVAYGDYIEQMKRDECLGWEYKVEHGKFGAIELKAFMSAAVSLGMHRALNEAANLLNDVIGASNQVKQLTDL